MDERDPSGAEQRAERSSRVGFRSAGRRPQVLLVEDDVALARTLRWALLAKCEVTAVGTAHEALGCLDGQWDAFLVDVALPDGCGLKLMRRARDAQPGAAALIISGHDRSEDADAAIAMGANFLAKPFTPSDLMESLDVCLRQRRAPGGAEGSRPTADFSASAEPDEASGPVPSPFSPEIAALVAVTRASGIQLAEAESRHSRHLGLLAKAVGSGRTSASNIDACAKATGVSRQILQNYATLTSRWDPGRIAQMLTMTDRRGRPVSRIALLRVARGPGSLRRAFEDQIANGQLDLAALFRDYEARDRRVADGEGSAGGTEPGFELNLEGKSQ